MKTNIGFHGKVPDVWQKISINEKATQYILTS